MTAALFGCDTASPETFKGEDAHRLWVGRTGQFGELIGDRGKFVQSWSYFEEEQYYEIELTPKNWSSIKSAMIAQARLPNFDWGLDTRFLEGQFPPSAKVPTWWNLKPMDRPEYVHFYQYMNSTKVNSSGSLELYYLSSRQELFAFRSF